MLAGFAGENVLNVERLTEHQRIQLCGASGIALHLAGRTGLFETGVTCVFCGAERTPTSKVQQMLWSNGLLQQRAPGCSMACSQRPMQKAPEASPSCNRKDLRVASLSVLPYAVKPLSAASRRAADENISRSVKPRACRLDRWLDHGRSYGCALE